MTKRPALTLTEAIIAIGLIFALGFGFAYMAAEDERRLQLEDQI